MAKGSGGTRASSAGSPKGLSNNNVQEGGSIDSVKGYQTIYNDLSRFGMSQADKIGYGLEAGQDGFVFSHARSNGAMARAEVVEFDKGQYQIMGAYDSRGHSIETLDRAFTFQGVKKYVAQLFKSWGHK